MVEVFARTWFGPCARRLVMSIKTRYCEANVTAAEPLLTLALAVVQNQNASGLINVVLYFDCLQ